MRRFSEGLSEVLVEVFVLVSASLFFCLKILRMQGNISSYTKTITAATFREHCPTRKRSWFLAHRKCHSVPKLTACWSIEYLFTCACVTCHIGNLVSKWQNEHLYFLFVVLYYSSHLFGSWGLTGVWHVFSKHAATPRRYERVLLIGTQVLNLRSQHIYFICIPPVVSNWSIFFCFVLYHSKLITWRVIPQIVDWNEWILCLHGFSYMALSIISMCLVFMTCK